MKLPEFNPSLLILKRDSGSKVQVQFSFDSEFSGNHWFEYSTAYSSSDQSGWYCMPEVGDTVRVFFPSGNEGQAFAASSTLRFMGQSPKDKVWMAHGKCIQLTENGIRISCDGEEAFIFGVNCNHIIFYKVIGQNNILKYMATVIAVHQL